MRCAPRGRWLLGPIAVLVLGFLASPAGAGQRAGSGSAEAQLRHGSSAHHGPSRGSTHGGWEREPAWQRPFGWNPGWGFGHGHHWGFSAAWRERVCDSLRAELGQRYRWGHAAFLLLFFGCAQPDVEPAPDPDPLAAPPEHTLLDGTGTAVADLGSVELDSSIVRVPFATSFSAPVVILGPPTDREMDPGMGQVLDVDDQGFRVRFREWDYLDGVHAAEAVSYLVLAPGRHQLSDGSQWEAGVLELSDTGAWGDVAFGAPFDAPPLVFLTVQTANEDGLVVARAREVTSTGFQAALFEEEGADGVRGVERVGYVAMASPPGSGRLDLAAGSLPYLLRSVVADDRRVPVLSASLWLEEEASLDDELTHADETLAFLAIGKNVFAQALSSDDLDTAAVRRAVPAYGPVMEWGTLSGVDDAWHTVPLTRDYTDPVVVVGPLSSADPAPAVVRVRNVSLDAFEMRVQSWEYVNRAHGAERVFYLVTDPGIQSLAGLVVQAGHLDSNLVLSNAQETVQLPLPYADVPGVFASVMTENGTQPVTVRVAGRTADGFRMAIQPEEAYAGGLPSERLGWVSIQTGRGVTTDGRVVSVFDSAVDHNWTAVPFGETLRGRFPTLLGTISSALGFDPVVLRYRDLTADTVALQLQEEQSANPETNHRAEQVSILVAE